MKKGVKEVSFTELRIIARVLRNYISDKELESMLHSLAEILASEKQVTEAEKARQSPAPAAKVRPVPRKTSDEEALWADFDNW